jgi:SOS-response transcriptional repressor LexA
MSVDTNLTPRQREVFGFIRDYIGRTGISPTLREISEAINLSVATTNDHVRNIVKRGFMVRHKGARGLSPAPEKGRTILPSLTPLQFKTLDFICTHIEKTGTPPLLSDVAKFNEISKATAFELLNAIAGKGYIARTPRMKAGITVLHKTPEVSGD